MTVPSDIVWSFAVGCGLAASSADGLRQADSAFVNKYFVYLAAYVCFLLSPSRVYLLWEHTGWATVFYYDATVSGLWPCAYLVAIASLSVIGYLVGWKLVQTDRVHTAYAVAASAYSCSVAVVGVAYERVLYAGDIGDWYSDVKYATAEFFSSQVFFTVMGLGTLTVPPVIYALTKWPNDENLMIKARKRALIWHSLKCYCLATTMKAAVFLVLIATSSLQTSWSYNRLLVFLFNQALWSLLLLASLFFIRTRHKSKKALN